MEYDYYHEEEMPKKNGRLSVKKLLKYFIIALIIVVYILMIFRIIIKEDPKSAKAFLWTDAAIAAYESQPDSFKVMNQQIVSFQYLDENSASGYSKQTYNTITDDGYFQVNNFMYIEATGELILTFRYNNASISWLKEKYGLNEINGEPYFLALSDSKGYITDYSYVSSSRFTYQYRRVVFSGVDLSQESTMDINIYRMQEDINLADPIATLPVYDSRIPVSYLDIKDALPVKAAELEKSPYVVTD